MGAVSVIMQVVTEAAKQLIPTEQTAARSYVAAGLSRIVQVLIVYQSMRWVFRVSIPDDPAWPRWPPTAALKSNRFAEAIRGGRQIMPVSLSLIGKIGVN